MNINESLMEDLGNATENWGEDFTSMSNSEILQDIRDNLPEYEQFKDKDVMKVIKRWRKTLKK